MHHQHQQQDSSFESDPQLPAIRIHHPASPRHHSSGVGATPTPTAGARRKIGVAVDLSDESAYAVRWAVHHYLRPGDAVILLHVSPTSVLFGADWGSIDLSISPSDFDRHPDEVTATATTTSSSSSNNQKKLEDDFDAFTASKAADLARPLREAQIPYKIHIVKDHDMKERLCLEVERLGLSAVIMGSRGFGAVRRGNDDGRLGSVSDSIVTNGIYRSIEHRATVNSAKERLSLATSYNPRREADIGPAPSLFIPESAALFKRIGDRDYLRGYLSRELDGKTYIDGMRIQNEEQKGT